MLRLVSLVCCFCAMGHAMDYFTFEIDGKKVGYYEEHDDGSVLYMNAYLELDGETFENAFWVRYHGTRVLEYKFADRDFVQFQQPDDVYPTSAFALVIRKLGEGDELTYRKFHEGRGEVMGAVQVKRNGNTVTEFVAGKIISYSC